MKNRFSNRRFSLLWITGILLPISMGGAQEEILFSRDIQPILSENCYPCHGPDSQTREADLRLDIEDAFQAETSSGKLVTAGTHSTSDLFLRITSSDPDLLMPPPESKLQLTQVQKEKIRAWIDSGARWDKLWSLVPAKKTALPKISLGNWPRNAIDSFVARELEKQGLEPAPAASREKLLRRVTLDLTGIPPRADQIEAFLSDTSPGAFEKVVDRLLASPLYGERMAWPWLDAARYADSNGFQGDGERTMWPWRDWVIDTINDNLPFDQFTIKQIAGDLLPTATPEDRLATAFCRNHMINGEGGRIAEENRVEYIFDQIETVGTVWLGMTFNCCRCHDHKFDPLLQKDYYALFAIFNRTPVNGGGGNPATPPNMKAPSFLQQRKLASLEPGLAELRKKVADNESLIFKRPQGLKPSESERAKSFNDELKKSIDLNPGSRNGRQLSILETEFQQKNSQYAATLKSLRKWSDQYNAVRNGFATVMIMSDTTERKTHRLERGLYNQPREEIPASLPTMFGVRRDAPPNRLDLANWLTQPSNPLTARVTVNRAWQLFFGTGLVKTPEDFGSQGSQPSHPELLDWLAVDFVESGWDLKRLHRLIVLSATYQQSARVNPRARTVDPENRLLSYSPRFRMPAWMLRDQALSLSGLMTHRTGGPSVKPYQPGGIWADATFGKKRYSQDHGVNLYRRSLYTFWRRIIGPTMFFDTAKRQTCEVKVSRTNSPLHALVTLNDPTFVEAARVLADRLLLEESTPTVQIAKAFLLFTSRKPRQQELGILLNRYQRYLEHFRKDAAGVESLLSTGEYPARSPQRHQLAALTMICSTLMNLDEALTR
ncbi:MAG: PSD1 and planctomycete cytochrome C domain-containing protein [Planctomycetota bacterium]|nr:PSD1 and planctomycete cytochrome C domain-containing protein [Planctomycetota bacterium]